MDRMPRQFGVSRQLPLAKIAHPQPSPAAQDNFWRFMRPMLTDEERIAGMANALRQWCATVEHEKARRVVYEDLGISANDAERLDTPALRRLQIEKERM